MLEVRIIRIMFFEFMDININTDCSYGIHFLYKERKKGIHGNFRYNFHSEFYSIIDRIRLENIISQEKNIII